jgi:hypothetical protein
MSLPLDYPILDFDPTPLSVHFSTFAQGDG